MLGDVDSWIRLSTYLFTASCPWSPPYRELRSAAWTYESL